MNFNYVDMHLMKAEVPLVSKVKFYPNEDEKKWANEIRKTMEGNLVVLVPNGSSVTKMWPHAVEFSKSLLARKNLTLIMLGDDRSMNFGELEDHKRFMKIGTNWNVRQAMTFCQLADVVIGQETGLLNCVSDEESVHKIVLFTHSSVENLTRDWPNTTSVRKLPACAGNTGCHRLHYDWQFCEQDEETKAAKCQAMISASEMVDKVFEVLDEVQKN